MWYKEPEQTTKPKEVNVNILNQDEGISKKAFYRYPDFENKEKIIDLDDLGDNTFVIGCNYNQKDSKYQIFIYKTQGFQISEEDESKYIENIKSAFFPEVDNRLIKILVQTPYQEDEEFINLFL